MSARATLVLAGVLAIAGCQAPVAAGTACVRASQCASGLTCALGRCRSACRTSADCAVTERCLVEASTGASVCSVAQVDDCASGTCPEGLVCHEGACVNACGTVVRCPDGVCEGEVCVARHDDAGVPDASADASADVGPVDAGPNCHGPGCDPVVDFEVASDGNGADHGRTYAVTASGALWAWGYAIDGLLGDRTTPHGDCADCSDVPLRALAPGGAPFDDVIDVASGDAFVCVVRRDTSVWCWGRNFASQLGNGGMLDSPVPGQVVAADAGGNTPLTGASAIAAGRSHACVVRGAAREVWCWGFVAGGGLGDAAGSASSSLALHATELGTDVTTLVLADARSMAVHADGTVTGVGEDGCATFGGAPNDAVVTAATLPTSMPRSFAGCDETSCAVSTTDVITCWGRGDDALGSSSPPTVACASCDRGCTGTPQTVTQPAPDPLTRLACRRGLMVFGTTAAGALYEWGNDPIAPLAQTPTPTRVPTTEPIADAFAGGEHACARTTLGDLLCWGDDTHGQLGLGVHDALAPIPTPTRVVWP